MNLTKFQTLRTGVKAHGAPASVRTLATLEELLRGALEGSSVVSNVEVGTTEDNNSLLVAMCSFDARLTEDEMAWTLEHLWEGLCFAHWEAHGFLTGEGHVEFQAATLSGVAGEYVTVHLVAQRAEALPLQPRLDEEPVLLAEPPLVAA